MRNHKKRQIKETYQAVKLQASKEGEQIPDASDEEIRALLKAIESDANIIDEEGDGGDDY